MSNNNPMESSSRMATLEGKMERVLERLDHYTTTLERLLPKIDQLVADRTEVALLKRDVSGINDKMSAVSQHVDAMTARMDVSDAKMTDYVNKANAKVEAYINRGRGIQMALNTLLSLIAGAAGAYAYFKDYINK